MPGKSEESCQKTHFPFFFQPGPGVKYAPDTMNPEPGGAESSVSVRKSGKLFASWALESV